MLNTNINPPTASLLECSTATKISNKMMTITEINNLLYGDREVAPYFLGCYPWDGFETLQLICQKGKSLCEGDLAMAVLNLDPSNMGGVHWIALGVFCQPSLHKETLTLIYFDPFGVLGFPINIKEQRQPYIQKHFFNQTPRKANGENPFEGLKDSWMYRAFDSCERSYHNFRSITSKKEDERFTMFFDALAKHNRRKCVIHFSCKILQDPLSTVCGEIVCLFIKDIVKRINKEREHLQKYPFATSFVRSSTSLYFQQQPNKHTTNKIVELMTLKFPSYVLKNGYSIKYLPTK